MSVFRSSPSRVFWPGEMDDVIHELSLPAARPGRSLFVDIDSGACWTLSLANSKLTFLDASALRRLVSRPCTLKLAHWRNNQGLSSSRHGLRIHETDMKAALDFTLQASHMQRVVALPGTLFTSMMPNNALYTPGLCTMASYMYARGLSHIRYISYLAHSLTIAALPYFIGPRITNPSTCLHPSIYHTP